MYLLAAPFLLTFSSPCLRVSLIKPLPPGLNFFSSSFAVSLKQRRTLKCGLRYTGLALWPCSVHHIPTTRCTEPLNTHHQSLCAICPPWLTCSFFCWHACYHTKLRLTIHFAGCKSVAASKYDFTANVFVNGEVMLICLLLMFSKFSRFLWVMVFTVTLFWDDLCDQVIDSYEVEDKAPRFSLNLAWQSTCNYNSSPLFCLTV